MDPLTLFISFTFFISTMFAIGLETDFSFFKRYKKWFRLLLSALIANYLIIPLITIVLLLFIPIESGIKAGLFFLAVAPGAPLSVQFAKGSSQKNSFSGFLLLVFSTLDLLITPFFVSLLFIKEPLYLNYHRLIAIVILCMLLPLLSGLIVRYRLKSIADMLVKPANIIASLAFPALIIVTLTLRSEAIHSIGMEHIMIILLLLLLYMGIGWIAGGPSLEDRNILVHHSCMRNTAFAYAVAQSSDLQPIITVTIAAFSALMVPVNLLYSLGERWLSKRNNYRKARNDLQ
jgi:BASS family bile acid:Na+ symporter